MSYVRDSVLYLTVCAYSCQC